MQLFYTVLKHISGLALLFFSITLIIVITDLENVPNVPLQSWFIKFGLIAGFFFINKICNKRILELQQNVN